MNPVSLSACELRVAKVDGPEERWLSCSFRLELHVAFYADGKWVIVTADGDDLGQDDLYRVRATQTRIGPTLVRHSDAERLRARIDAALPFSRLRYVVGAHCNVDRR